MAGCGPTPKPNRRRRNKPARGEWQPSTAEGWQHGPMPEPPDGLLAASRIAWETWFHSWFAAKWEPAALPVLRQLIVLFDVVERGQAKSADRSELRQLLDGYGVTPRGQATLRWQAPKPEDKPVDDQRAAEAPSKDPYRHLRAVS